MTMISFSHADNFTRNLATIKDGGGLSLLRSYAPIVTSSPVGHLPVSVEVIADHLRVDDVQAETNILEIMCEGACDFIEIRTSWALRPKRYQFYLDSLWADQLTVHRGPLRGNVKVEVYGADGTWEIVPPSKVHYVEEGRQFRVWLEDVSLSPRRSRDGVRVSFEAGFDNGEETGSIHPIHGGLRMLLLMITGHYYKNREIIGATTPRFGVEAVELGATSLLGAYRSYL